MARLRTRTRAVLVGCIAVFVVSGPCAVPGRRGLGLGLGLALQASQANARQPRIFETTIAESGLEDWSVKDYEAMRDDVPRTSKFAAAIQRRLSSFPAATVVDIGTGPFALLAIIAARAGAKKVFAIEKNPEAVTLARETVKQQGLEDVVQIIEGDSMKVELPEKVDFIVSELIGSIATQEGVEPIIRDARQRFLKEGCGMIPLKCQTCIVPVLYKGRSLAQRVFTPFEGVRSRGTPQAGTQLPLRIKPADEDNLEFLSEPQVLEDFDYCGGESVGQDQILEFPVKEGTFSGFAMWTRVVVDDKDVIEVRGQPDSHWAYVVALMAPQSKSVEPGTIKLESKIDYSASPVRYSFRAEVP